MFNIRGIDSEKFRFYENRKISKDGVNLNLHWTMQYRDGDKSCFVRLNIFISLRDDLIEISIFYL